MIDVTFAVTAAIRYFEDLEKAVNASPPGTEKFSNWSLENLRLEEVRKTDDSKHWLITLGYDAPSKPSQVRSLFPSTVAKPEHNYSREYKLFRVNGDTGEVEAMEIRKV